MAISSICERCNSHKEGIIHVLKDYCNTKDVWQWVVDQDSYLNFFHMNIKEWVIQNAKDGTNGGWHITFFLTCEVIRCCRYKKTIEGTLSLASEQLQHIHALHKDYLLAFKDKDTNCISKEPRLASWANPPKGVIKINMDDNSMGNHGLASSEGLLRNHLGVGFQVFHIVLTTSLTCSLGSILQDKGYS